MKLKLFVVGCAFVCFCADATEVVRFPRGLGGASESGSYPSKKRLRGESDLIHLEPQKKLCTSNEREDRGKIKEIEEKCENVISEIGEKETIAAEQLVRLCRSEISKQDDPLISERIEVVKARCDFLAAVREVLMWRQSRSRIYSRAMMLGMDMAKCKRELQILENRMKSLEENMEKSKQEAIDSFLLLKKIQIKSKL